MRKVLTVVLALSLVISLTGVFALGAGPSDQPGAATVYDVSDNEVPVNLPDGLVNKINSGNLEGVEKLIVVKPKGIESGKWVERANGNEEVMVWVDPIYVGP